MGGVLTLSARDLDRCLLACLHDITCLGVDYNVVDRSCWTHNATTICGLQMTNAVNITHYQLTSCPPSGLQQTRK